MNKTTYSWRDNMDLIARLTAAQNSVALENVDVMTFAGMCDSRAELERHVVFCEIRAQVGKLQENNARDERHEISDEIEAQS